MEQPIGGCRWHCYDWHLLLDNREPRVSILGPKVISAQVPAHTGQATYSLKTRDMRGNLQIIRLVDGRETGRLSTQQVTCDSPGLDPAVIVKRVRVQVTDVDGLVASDEIGVRFVVTLPPGTERP